MVNMPHMLKYMGPRGLYINIKGLLATKAATWRWFDMVIGIDHLHIHNGKFAPYVEIPFYDKNIKSGFQVFFL